MASSGSIWSLIPDGDDAIHVGYDGEHWWAVTKKEGSYGGSRGRPTAIQIAMDASASAFHGAKRIVVHHKNGAIDCIITKVHQKPSSQFFQDWATS